MFTPPPSPLPQSQFPSFVGHDNNDGRDLFIHTTLKELEEDVRFDTIPSVTISPVRTRLEEKLMVARRTRWSILLVPAVLMLVGLSTRYASHPAALDAFANPSSDWATNLMDWHQHKPHKRSPQLENLSNPLAGPTIIAPSLSQSSFIPSQTTSSPPTTTSLAQTQQTVPAVPINPTLPLLFPQPFDTTLSNNFSTMGCDAFFQNMTQTDPFRTCRPFSLLLQSSESFIEAQTNLTNLNTIMWGTCNTDTSEEQCIANMGWFAQELQVVCKIDLQNQVATAVNGLIGLQAYSVMRTVGCLADQQTGAYCYLEAAHNSNPSDAYIYQLPLGIPLPVNTTMSCDQCTSSVLSTFEQSAANLTSLQSTYDTAAKPAAKQCGGTTYAAVLSSSNAGFKSHPEVLGVLVSVIFGLWSVFGLT